MATVWFSFLVLILVHDVFAVVCPENSDNIKSCDECMRCGGMWCTETKGPHCAYYPSDTFCGGQQDKRYAHNTEKKNGTLLTPHYVNVTTYVGTINHQDFTFKSEAGAVNIFVLNSTQNKAAVFMDHENIKCQANNCKVTIKANVDQDFCTTKGTIEEFIYVNVQVPNLNETSTIQYHVPCACSCSLDAIHSASQCSGHGDFSCGVCLCHEGWCGDKCETQVEVKSKRCNYNGDYACGTCICEDGWCGADCKYSNEKETKSPLCNGHGDFSCGICNCHWKWEGSNCTSKKDFNCDDKTGDERGHGDVPCHSDNPFFNRVECSGNGYCDLCDRCRCYDDMPNSRYLIGGFCSDVCMETRGCDYCITNGTLGECFSPQEDHCMHLLTVLAYNKTVAEEEDETGRIWLPCNATFRVRSSECYVEYVAMKDDHGISVMVVRSCNDANSLAIIAGGGTEVPIIVGALFLVAGLAAAAGFVAWKHFHKTPPPYLNVGDETNVDGENCVGENPLYKSPTSTFTNPQFGKC